MKKIRMAISALVLSLILLTFAYSSVGVYQPVQLPEEVPVQVVIYNQPTLDCRFIRSGDSESAAYYFVGRASFPNGTLDVRQLSVYSTFDATHVVGTLINRTLQVTDSCTNEFFGFMVDGAEVRTQLEKPGNATIVIFGAMRTMALELSPPAEKAMLEAILVAKDSGV